MYRRIVRILLLDAEPMFIAGLRVALCSIPGQELVAVIRDIKDLEEGCIQYKPDVVFVRDFLDNSTGFSATKIIKRSFPEIKVIMIISLPKAALIREAQYHGVDSCILACDEPAFYNTCLWNTLNDKPYFPVISDNKWGSFDINLQENCI